MNLKKSLPIILVTLLVLLPALINAHCQIPCGIYDDATRFKLMREHVETIEKSMNTVMDLQKEDEINYNQLVRWVNNKDAHADKFNDIVTYYFMTQRIKPVEESKTEAYKKYQNQVELLHKMLVYSMKAKQTTDLENVEKLRKLITKFEDSYFEEHGHKH
ncbi:MAG TPA: superoxide dismutase [Ni] [bacterium]|nr:superoxide dismutase [Ni] [bacterium]